MGGAPRANIQTMGYIHITTQSPPVTVTEAAAEQSNHEVAPVYCSEGLKIQDSILSVNGMCLRQ